MSLVKPLSLMFLEFFLNLFNAAHFFFVFTHRLIMTCGGGAMILLFGDFEVGSHRKNSYNVFDNYALMGVKSPNNFLKEKSWAKWIQAKASQALQAQKPLWVQHLLTVQANAWKNCVAAWRWVWKIKLVLTSNLILAKPLVFATSKKKQLTVKSEAQAAVKGLQGPLAKSNKEI